MKNLLKALANFHKKITCIPKTEENPFHHSKYSGLDTVYNHIKDALLDSGLWYYHKSNITEDEEGIKGIEIRTILYHIESGESMDFAPVQLFPKDQDNPQAWGSCITYAKRYSLQLILGLPSEEEDDDANAGAGLKEVKLKEAKKEYKLEKKEKSPKQEEEKAEEKPIPFWMEMAIKKINDVEKLEKFFKENQEGAKKFGNYNSLVEHCKKRKEEIEQTILENANEDKKRKKTNSPEKDISKTSREELISLLKYYIDKVYSADVNPLDLFVDDDGIVPASLDKIPDNEILRVIEKLKSMQSE